MTSLPRSSGIYIIVCIKSDNIYIGSSNNLQKRWNEHQRRLNKSDHDNSHLQRAWNKYGAQAFQFKVLEYCSIDQLDEREQHYIKIYKTRGICYNITDGGRGTKGVVRSSETRAKMSVAAIGRKHTGETREKLRLMNTGKHHTSETRMKLSEISKNNAESRAVLIARDYVVTSPQGEEMRIKNLSKFCRDNGLTKQGMTLVAQSKQKHHKNWRCRYDQETVRELEGFHAFP